MVTTSTIIMTIAGIVLTLIICWLFFKSRSSVLKANFDNLNSQFEQYKTEAQEKLQEAKNEFEKRVVEVKADEQRHYESALAEKDKTNSEAMRTLKENYAQAIKEQQERFDITMGKLVAENKAATEEMLKSRQKEFAESSSTNIGQIVNPLKETIAKMEKTMQESSEKTVSISSAMKESLRQVVEQSKAAQASTEGLTNVLKHTTKAQGDWGETILTELLESQGLTEGVHFHTQATIRDERGMTVRSEEGNANRPDVILHLDSRREVIIDSKVSLTAFFNYVNADNDEARQQYLKEHIASIQKHVAELAKKNYTAYIQPPKVKMDYVIMFVPHAGALWTALNAKTDLWRTAMAQNVYIADEQTLFAALKIINMTWTQIKQAQNHEEVYKLANEMVERVGQFVKKYAEVGTKLSQATAAFEDGSKKLSDNGQSIIVSANKLIKLGAKQSQRNPVPELLDVDEVAPVNVLPEEDVQA